MQTRLTPKTVTNSENRAVKMQDVYEEFVLWSAMPPSERVKLGIETQDQFVTFYKIGINTPTAWKKRHDYEPRVTAIRKEWGFSKTSAVIEGIYRSALKGNPYSQKLWLQYFHGFSEKTEVKHTAQIEITVDDIRFLIDGLPEPLRSEHYGNLRKLLIDSQRLRREGFLDDKARPEDYYKTSLIEEINQETLETKVLPEKAASQFKSYTHTTDYVPVTIERQPQTAERWW